MNRFFALDALDGPPLRLRAAVHADLELLPYEAERSDAARLVAFESYLGRPDDYLFVVESDGRAAGVIGGRRRNGVLEIYGERTIPPHGGAATAERARRLLTAFLNGDKTACRRTLPGAEGAAERADLYPIPLDASRLGPDRPLAVHLDEETEAVAVLADGKPRVFQDLCPHMGAPLSRGSYSAATCALTCPWHGYAFDVRTGEMTGNPNDRFFARMKAPWAAARKTAPPRWRLRALTCVEADGKTRVERGA